MSTMSESTLGGHDARIDAFRPSDPERIARLNRLYRELSAIVEDERDVVRDRYAAAAEAPEAALCCPVDYSEKNLEYIPERNLEVDYGCGDPTVFAQPGETVLDLGSGSGKHCFMISKKVGPEGRVIGIDKTPAMLELAREAVPEVARRLGHPAPNVEFRRGSIDNLRIDRDRLDGWLSSVDAVDYDALQELDTELGRSPMVADASVDLVVSNCVLNLVDDERKRQLFSELFRVVRKGGRVAISDIVSDRPVPAEMKRDPELWSGCVSGAMTWRGFLDAFAEAGFYGVQEVKSYFWQEVQGIPFFSVTVLAYKGKQGPCYETYRKAIYRGPYSAVTDDDGHVYPRGTAVPVCEKTAGLLTREPYAGHFDVTPALADAAEKIPFDCSTDGAVVAELPPELQSKLVSSLREQADCDPDSGCC